MATCYIVGAGEFTPRDLAPKPGDLVIAADGGYRALEALGIRPDLLMGDLDSLGDYPFPDDLPLERFPVEKDDTDTGIALSYGLRMGFCDFALYGCSGGRVDHLLANWQSMCRVSRLGASVRMAAKDYDAYALSNGRLDLPARPQGTLVSIFCLSAQAQGVTIEGLKYTLENAELTSDYPLGVSNEHMDKPASVSVESGTLLVIQHLALEN